jgi:predicted transcriptional regulator of viral defense system
MKKNIEEIFKIHSGIVTNQVLKESGVYHYQIRDLLAQQAITRIKRGVYKWNDGSDNQDELLEVSRLVPKGVVCLISAALHYELTTFVPAQYQIAIHRKDKVSLPEYPPIKLFYWSDVAYQLGREQITMEYSTIAIYDIEKTVCDIIKYRDKIGMDTCKEIIRNYLDKEERNLVKLSNYAEKMGLSGVVSNLIKILV